MNQKNRDGLGKFFGLVAVCVFLSASISRADSYSCKDGTGLDVKVDYDNSSEKPSMISLTYKGEEIQKYSASDSAQVKMGGELGYFFAFIDDSSGFRHYQMKLSFDRDLFGYADSSGTFESPVYGRLSLSTLKADHTPIVRGAIAQIDRVTGKITKNGSSVKVICQSVN